VRGQVALLGEQHELMARRPLRWWGGWLADADWSKGRAV